MAHLRSTWMWFLLWELSLPAFQGVWLPTDKTDVVKLCQVDAFTHTKLLLLFGASADYHKPME